MKSPTGSIISNPTLTLPNQANLPCEELAAGGMGGGSSGDGYSAGEDDSGEVMEGTVFCVLVFHD